MSDEFVHICITGAAGQIGYVLAFRVANNELNIDKKICLHLLEVTPALPRLEGVVMELQDCAFPNLAKVIATDDPNVAFKDCDYAFLVGSFPRKEGMDRADLLGKNGGIFKVQGEALSANAKKSVKVLVVGNPANTNCAIALHFAKNLGPENFSSMSRLDHNRMLGELANKKDVTPSCVHKCVIWGNHSNTQVNDVEFAEIELPDGLHKVTEVFDESYLRGEFMQKVSTRGGAVIKARGASSAASAAHAALGQMKSWIHGTPEGDWVSMSVPTPASKPYGVEAGLVFSFPVTITDGKPKIVEGLQVNEFYQSKIALTVDELSKEKKTAWEALNIQ